MSGRALRDDQHEVLGFDGLWYRTVKEARAAELTAATGAQWSYEPEDLGPRVPVDSFLPPGDHPDPCPTCMVREPAQR